MPSIFYELFNNLRKIDVESIRNLISELTEFIDGLKKKGEVDELKVLINKSYELIEKSKKKIDKKAKKEFKNLEELLEDAEDFVKQKKEEEEIKLIDVVKSVEKKYRHCPSLKKEKEEIYAQVCVKKENIKYEKKIVELQLELVKLQRYIKESGEKVLIIFEGRDAAGKGGTIKRFTEYLNPRGARVVALEKPNEKEKSQWYFQRYVSNLPSAGEMVFFDRSWYNRGGVEPVMGFVTKKDYEQFLEDVPKFEKMLVNSGIKLVKFYFSVSKEEQARRFDERRRNPLKQFKLSPIDQVSQNLWDKYTLAEYKNFSVTHSKDAPWTIVKSDDKKKARINAIKYLLNQFDYTDKIEKSKLTIDKKLVITGADKTKHLKEKIDITKDLFE
ncbi:polyphosphate kinase 2 [Candidatus Gracilibacteria bacterium]|nr:polyphosphate kinase 2 [Candidatus Gracilibacteria bacterium]